MPVQTDNPKSWASKLAYAVPAPKTHSTGKILPKTKRTTTAPAIGQRKVAPPVPPAAADAQAASAAMTPAAKTAGCKDTAGLKKAPRYSSAGKKGKKVMPLPHAKMQKKAYTLMNNSCEMIGTIKTDRIHDGMETARAIGGGLLCDTELEKIAKLNYLERLSAAEKRGKHAVWAVKQAFAADSAPMLTQPGATPTAADPAAQQPLPPPMPGMGEGPAGAAPMPPQAGGPSLFGKMLGGGMPMGPTGSMTSQPGSAPATPAPPAAPAMPGTGGSAGGGMAKAGAHEKQALGGLGTLIGAAGGGLMAPSGNKMEGVGRGVGQGLGWDVGGALGGGLGSALGPAIMAAIAKHQGRQVTPEELSGAAGVGALGGYGLGGFAGKGLAGNMMGDPTWKSKEEESLKQEAALA